MGRAYGTCTAVVVGTPDKYRLHVRTRHRWEDNTEMDAK
jgi:hypothetical protein